MRVGDSYIEGAAGGRSRACWGRARVRLTRLLIVLVAVTGLGGVMAVGALANSYTGLLYAGTLNITSNGSSESGGYIYGDDSWTAPTGTLFAGFAYTSGAFSAKSDNSVGGVSAGFGGDGARISRAFCFRGPVIARSPTVCMSGPMTGPRRAPAGSRAATRPGTVAAGTTPTLRSRTVHRARNRRPGIRRCG